MSHLAGGGPGGVGICRVLGVSHFVVFLGCRKCRVFGVSQIVVFLGVVVSECLEKD